MEALLLFLPLGLAQVLAVIFVTAHIWDTEIPNWLKRKLSEKDVARINGGIFVKKKDEVFEWFEKIALLVEMGELIVTQDPTDQYGTVCFLDSERFLKLRLYQELNWWNAKNQDKYICIDGELKKDFLALDVGNNPRVKQTTPIHKFLKQPEVEKSQVDKMIDAAIEKHGSENG